jgi:hypothetical protein
MSTPRFAGRIAFVVLLISLSGCATCQQHPVWCAVGSAIVVGSIAASIDRDHRSNTAVQINPVARPVRP